MKPPSFLYERADDLGVALEFVDRYAADGKVLAGGQSLIPLLNLRLARPSALLDINGVADLDEIRIDDGTIRFGALVRQAELQTSALVRERVPLLVEAVRHVGHAQIRNRGTVGGSVAHADPAAELPACFAALDGRFHLRSLRGERVVAFGEFFRGPLTTALADDELLVGVEARVPCRGSGQAFLEMARRHGDFAIGGVAAIVHLRDDGVCGHAAIAMLAAGDTPVRAGEAEALLTGNLIDEEVAREAAKVAVRQLRPPNDIHGSTEFRRRVLRELVRRTLLVARARATPAAD